MNFNTIEIEHIRKSFFLKVVIPMDSKVGSFYTTETNAKHPPLPIESLLQLSY